MSLYTDLKALGVPMDSHESDLYCKATPEALALLKSSGRRWHYFHNQVTGDVWCDVPFAFEPWWEAHTRKVSP